MKRLYHALVSVGVLVVFLLAGCSQSAPLPTAAPPAKGAEPTRAAPAPTVAQPTSQPTAAPAKKVEYPVKGRTITLIVPFGVGGGSDVAARILSGVLEQDLGVPVQVVNKPGASTQTGATELAAAKPDGYTLGMATGATIVTYLDPERKAVYSGKDFQPVALLCGDDLPLTAKGDGPFKTLKDLIDAAKGKPEQVKGGTAGLLTPTHLVMLALGEAAGVRFAPVHFDAPAATATALLGGHIDFMTVSSAATLPHFKSGAARVLAVMGKEETKTFPGVKTLEAQGYKVYGPAFYGVLAPGGTPKEIVDILSNSIIKGMESGSLKDKLYEVGLTPSPLDSVRFGSYWKDMEASLKPLVDLAKKQQ